MLEDKSTIRNQVAFDSVDPTEWGIFESDTDSHDAASEADTEEELEKVAIQKSKEAAKVLARKTEADLTRQTGDFDCYKIYVRSMGMKVFLALIFGSLIHVAMNKMPRSSRPFALKRSYKLIDSLTFYLL